jgi:branched-chain amino acid transport system substrate-binding protein
MKKVSLIVVLLLVAAFIFGCSTSSSTPSATIAKPAATTAPATSSAAPSTSNPPSTTSAPASSASSAEPIKIGALFSLTGEGQMVGPAAKAAIEFRLDQIGYQVAGRKIQLVAEDDATDPTTGVDKARKLVQFDKVDVILGPVAGMTAPGVAGFIGKNSIPMLVFMGKPSAILQPSNNVFLPFGTDGGTGYQSGLYAASKLGYKTAVVIYEDFVSGVAYADAATAAFTKLGGTITQRIPVKFGTVDFSPYLTSMKQADVVMFWFNPPVTQRFVTQYLASGIKMPMYIMGSSQLIPRQLTQFGDKTLGMYGIGQYSTLLDTQINKDYIAAFGKKYDPGLLMDQGVTADVGLLEFLDAVKMTNGDTTPAKTVDALHKIKTVTPAGTFSFNPQSIGIGNYYIQQVIKTGDNQYNWKVIDTINQVLLDVPVQ